MKTLVLQDAPDTRLAQALAEFETQFTYPLGPGRAFRISHGDDYPRFFRAMGQAASIVVTDGDKVFGVVGIAVRKLLLPEGREMSVAYFGDLKVDPAARRSFVYLRLVWAADAWLKGRASVGFGVVMDGTSATPDAYTGSIGIPAARVLGKTIVWQFPCHLQSPDAIHTDSDTVLACYRQLSRGRYASLGADPAHRSEMEPVGLVLPDGGGCGLVEDTRLCKRLITDDGTELRSAHLSFFAFRRPADGARVIRTAIDVAGRAGHPALFVAIAPHEAHELEAALGPHDKVVAPATIFGSGLDDGVWNINTSEI
jgi:hypothetical protein